MNICWGVHLHRILIKAISLAVICFFSIDTILFGIGEINMPYENVVTAKENDLFLPTDLGFIKNVYKANSDRLIVHIQDAHCNYEAQKKIAEIILYITSKFSAGIINVEGGSGYLSILMQKCAKVLIENCADKIVAVVAFLSFFATFFLSLWINVDKWINYLHNKKYLWRIKMLKQKEWIMIRNLYLQGMKKSEIARRLGVHRNTVINNLKRESTPIYKRSTEKPSKIESYKEYIEARLEKYDLTARKVYEGLQKQGYMGKYGIIAKYIRKTKKDYRTKAVLRFETLPGEQSQVDWGYFGTFYDKEQKRTIKLHCFFIILGYSRTLYIEFFEKADIVNFLKGHNNAFEYFGGYTREILYDNLKSVVIKRALKAENSTFNKKFMDFAGYYGLKPILCRPYKPNTKGKVENSVLYAKQNFFVGEEFISLKDINKKALLWLEERNVRIHGTTKEKPFDRLKREGLNAIKDRKLYDTNMVKYRLVFNDCHFSYNANHYSVPYQYAGKEISVKSEGEKNIVVQYREKEIARHDLEENEKGKYCTNPEHLKGLKEILPYPRYLSQSIQPHLLCLPA